MIYVWSGNSICDMSPSNVLVHPLACRFNKFWSLICGICFLIYLLLYILVCMWWFYSGGTSTSSSKQTSGHQKSSQQHSSYQIPASALYESADNPRASGSSIQTSPVGISGNCHINVYVFLFSQFLPSWSPFLCQFDKV